MPSVEGLRFAYVLHPLPPAGFGFRRWRWELWHGASLLAAGWRTSPKDAERALQAFAARAAHRMFGLAPRELAKPGRLTPGAVHRLDTGAVTCLLVPRALEAELAAAR